MDVILGIKVRDSVIIATSKAATRGISILQANDDKTRALSKHSLLAYTGESGDTGMSFKKIISYIELICILVTDPLTNNYSSICRIHPSKYTTIWNP